MQPGLSAASLSFLILLWQQSETFILKHLKPPPSLLSWPTAAWFAVMETLTSHCSGRLCIPRHCLIQELSPGKPHVALKPGLRVPCCLHPGPSSLGYFSHSCCSWPYVLLPSPPHCPLYHFCSWWHGVGARHVGSRCLSFHICDQHSCELFDILNGTSREYLSFAIHLNGLSW